MIQQSAFAPLLKEIYDEWTAEASFSYELASAKLTEFFIKAERALGGAIAPFGKVDQQMLMLTDYIDANIANEITLSAVSQMAGMTQSAFSRKFAAINGITFKEYVVERKLERAIFLLQNTQMKMSEIALECGFDSISGFYCAFKKRLGTTPSKFAKGNS